MSQLPYEAQLLLNSSNSDKTIDIEQKIVEELLNDSNLDRKTELDYPIKWAALNTILEYLIAKKMVKSAEILQNFQQSAFKYLISKNRKGRLEYLEALKGIQQSLMMKDKEAQNLMKQ